MIGRVAWLLIMLLVWSGGGELASAQEAELTPAKGLLLLSREQLPDPRFRDSVILLLQHDDQGTVGLIINKTSRLPLSAVWEPESDLSFEGETLSYGGPIEPETLLALVRVEQTPPEMSERIAEGLYLVGLESLARWQKEPEQKKVFRVFTGYAGWAPGQLAVELAQNDWQVVAIDVDSLFGGEVSELWRRLRVDCFAIDANK